MKGEELQTNDQGFIVLNEPKELAEILTMLYTPATNVMEAEELLDGTEIMEAVSIHCTTSREFLFRTLVDQGFTTVTIENTLYWLINFNK